MKSIVILVSGRGSNLQAILEAQLPIHIDKVISNRPGAGALAIAQSHGIETVVVDHQAYRGRDDFDVALRDQIGEPDAVVLAGFMRILGADFVEHYRRRLINIHPSLLPAFPGLHTHRRALEAGVRIHGCTVHFVTSTLDGGPIIAQAAVPVYPNDDEQGLAERVLAQEHRVYPAVLRAFANGQLNWASDERVEWKGEREHSEQHSSQWVVPKCIQ